MLNDSVNPNLQLAPRRLPDLTTWTDEILRGNRVRLAQAITLVESTRAEHQALAQALIANCLRALDINKNQSLRIGITGTPGVGKSTFIETFGEYLTSATIGRKVAVLAIDPSSQVTSGSILGDKTRMQRLATNPNAFIRPSPSSNSLGGVARQTRETITLCEAAGFDTIIVETVGVGQSETAVHSMTDFFLLLLQPNAGDELQGIKRGIVEMADLIAINKADGENEKAAQLAQRQYQNALHLFPVKPNQWLPQVLTCSALIQRGIADIWLLIQDFEQHTKANHYFENHRREQNVFWLRQSIERALQQQFYGHPAIKTNLENVEILVKNGTLSPFEGAKRLLSFL